jgi:arylsulfatase A-like enzyme
MDRAEFLKKASLVTAGLALLPIAPPLLKTTAAQAAKPNILLIMTDDQPYHTIRAMQSLQDRVVARGMQFTNGYVATPICGPARGTVLTGKWSHNTGLEDTVGAWRDLVDSGALARNIGKRLEAIGYACHLAGKFTNDLNSGKWMCPGFDSWWSQLEKFNDRDHIYFSKGVPDASRYPEAAPRRATKPWWQRRTRIGLSATTETYHGSPVSGRTPRMNHTYRSTATRARTRAIRPRPRSENPAGTSPTRHPSSAKAPASRPWPRQI